MKENNLFIHIPESLKLEALWCCWKFTLNEQGDNIKKPYNVLTGYGAKSNDKKTFVSYPTMLRYFDQYYSVSEEGKMLGGAGLGIFNGFCAIDIDHCVNNGEISDMAQDIIKYCDSYTELSPSKTGIRIIFKTYDKVNKDYYYINNSKLGLEIYISDNTNKYVSITGNKLCGDEVKTIDIKPLLEKYMKREIPLVANIPVNRNVSISLNEALNKDDKLFRLWNTTAPGSHANESELDMALCCKLAFYLNGDEQEIMNAFMSSPYYNSKDNMHKNKWNSGYGKGTIVAAINFTNSHTPMTYYTNNNGEVIKTDYKQQDYKPIITEPVMPISNPVKYGWNDTGNAHRFADKFETNIHYNVDNEKWMLWNGKYWETDIKGKIRDYVDELAKDLGREAYNEQDLPTKKLMLANMERIQNNAGKKALLEECQHIGDIPVLNSDFDNDDYLICTPNMVYDLYNNKALPHNKKYMMSQCLACDIDLDNEPTRWLQFLNEIFENDKEMINYCRKVLAYCMSGSTREQQMWIFYGDGNNGKSLLLEIFNEIMGSYGVTSRPELLIDSKNANTSSEEIARLKGKRVTVMEEIKDGDRMNESLVKQLTSGVGKMTGRFLYGNTFEFIMKAKILQASNYKSKIKGIDKGIWRRVNLVPLYKDFTKVADKDLRDKLIAELPQIAGWLVKGFAIYLEEGLDNKPEKVNKETKEYKEESDLVQSWINENCEIGDNKYHANSSDLFKDFTLWLKNNQESNMTQTAFGRNMGKKFRRLTYSNGKYYVGVKLRETAINNERKIAYDTVIIDDKDI